MRGLFAGFLVLGLVSCGEKDGDGSSAPGMGGEETAAPETGDDSGSVEVDEDEDEDGYTLADGDCDDADAEIHPDATEVCDEIDNDCDGLVDDDDPGVDPDTQHTWYADADGDGYGSEDYTWTACAVPDGYVAASEEGFDCDDLDARFHPGAEESCEEAVDTNCDGSVAYEDADGDGWAACVECNDADASVHPDADEVCDGLDNDCDGFSDEDDEDLEEDSRGTWYADVDGDGFGDETRPVRSCEAPEDMVPEGESGFDCDDEDPDIHPDADEICDGVDNDCDAVVDEDVEEGGGTFYTDADMDGYGDPGSPVEACAMPAGTVLLAGDCDDHDDDIHPGATELCDGEDNDCDGTTDEDDASGAPLWFFDADRDGYGNPDSAAPGCSAPAGHVALATDCDDADPSVHPGADEYCNERDDDCDGDTDEDSAVDAPHWYPDGDGDGYGDPAGGVASCEILAGHLSDPTDCNDADASIHPGADEYCNGQDDDCDGTTDEDTSLDALTWYLDADGDGYGDAGATHESCAVPAGYLEDATDCHDGDDSIHPGAEDVCDDEVDNDCDGEVDEGCGTCEPSGPRVGFNTLAADTASGCWSGNPCARDSYSWSETQGQNFQGFGQSITCSGTTGCVQNVGITTYASSSTVCQGDWDVYCDGTWLGTLETLGRSCSGTAMTNGCDINFEPLECSSIQLTAVTDGDSTSGCCGGSQPDSMITAVSAW